VHYEFVDKVSMLIFFGWTNGAGVSAGLNVGCIYIILFSVYFQKS